MDAWGVNKDNLRLGERFDTGEAVARGLGLGGDNGNFAAKKLVKQGRFAHVGPAHNSTKPTLVLGRRNNRRRIFDRKGRHGLKETRKK
jgi:hypothetical protein